MTRKTKSQPGQRAAAARPLPDFDAVKRRHRNDGWTPARQVDFIEALGECGCVDEACARVGMSPSSAYTLRRQPDAQSFRIAWDTALDYAIRRLSDAAFGRALHGVARPVFFQGQQIGERRYYDERLTQFLLRYRDPTRYGKWRDDTVAEQHPDGPAILLAKAIDRVADDAYAAEAGDPPPRHPPFQFARRLTPEQEAAEADARAERRENAQRDAVWKADMRRLDEGVGT